MHGGRTSEWPPVFCSTLAAKAACDNTVTCDAGKHSDTTKTCAGAACVDDGTDQGLCCTGTLGLPGCYHYYSYGMILYRVTISQNAGMTYI